MSNTSSSPSPSSADVTAPVKYRGVRKRKWGKYVSEIRLPNSRDRIWLGSYDTPEKAARAFDAATLCLRGRHAANFNFPHDPPDIAAAGNHLSPSEIQAVAQQYANSHQPPPPPAELGEASSSEMIDWSFLDELGAGNCGGNYNYYNNNYYYNNNNNNNNNNNDDNVGSIWDYGLFHEPDDMHMAPYYVPTDHDGSDDDDDSNGNASSFLWSF